MNQLLRQISTLPEDEKKSVIKLLRSDCKDELIEILLQNTEILDNVKEKMGLSQDIIASFNKLFANEDFISIEDFFENFKTLFESIYQDFSLSILKCEDGIFVKDLFERKKTLKLSDFNLELKNNPGYFNVVGENCGIYIETKMGNYFLEFDYKGSKENFKNRIIKLESLFKVKSIELKINHIINNFKASYVDDLTQAFTKIYLHKLEKKGNYSVMYLDLDDFKSLNDTYGHSFGDDVLKRFSSVILSSIRKNDKLIRVGGDEFVICVDTKSQKVLNDIKNRILLAVSGINISSPLIKDEKIYLSTSVGLQIFKKELNLDDMIDYADSEMYKDKENKDIKSKIHTLININGNISSKYAQK